MNIFLLVIFCLSLVCPKTKAAVADVISEIVDSHRRVNDEIFKTIRDNVETSPILRAPERIRKVVVTGSFVPKLPNDGPLSLLKPENLGKLLPSGDHKTPGPFGLVSSFFTRPREDKEITEDQKVKNSGGNVSDLLPTRSPVQAELPPLVKQVPDKDNAENNVLPLTVKPISGKTLPTISLDVE